MLIGCGGLLTFGVAAALARLSLLTPEVITPWFVVRTVSELASAILFVIAIVHAVTFNVLRHSAGDASRGVTGGRALSEAARKRKAVDPYYDWIRWRIVRHSTRVGRI